MSLLPSHGQITCATCFSCNKNDIVFDQTQESTPNWRITNNPLAWGSSNPEIIVLGFSKGPTQSGALSSVPHNDIAFKGGRANIDKILNFLNVTPQNKTLVNSRYACDSLINNEDERFHFGSLIRCTVERFDSAKNEWKGSGGGMLDKFVKTDFGQMVSQNCASKYLSNLPFRTKLVVMFGLCTKLNYVHQSFKLFEQVRGGNWRWINEVAYTDGLITIVHVEHFASQGSLIPNWLGVNDDPRQKYGLMARDVVNSIFNK
jgi:hypothetical protein